MNIILSYDFWVVAIGTMILGAISSIFGCYMVQEQKGLIGDAIGHASYPGVIIAYIIFYQRSTLLLLGGSALMGTVAYYTITYIKRNSFLDYDTALAVVLTGFFGLGMMLKTFIQGNSHYLNASQAGLRSYIFGMASYITLNDVIILVFISFLFFLYFLLTYNQYKILIFDRIYAEVIGVPVKFLDCMLTIIMIILISLGIKMIGAILISSYLIIPSIFAHLCNYHGKKVLLWAVFCAVASSFIGTFISTLFSGFSTGATMIVCMSLMVIICFIYSLIKKRIIL